jgi:transformation/transcription domain-associated protein
MLELLRVENEDNAVYCMKTLVDLHKNYRSELESMVKPFVDIVMEMYTNMEQAVKESFDNYIQVCWVLL